jgi:hypothetical protein
MITGTKGHPLSLEEEEMKLESHEANCANKKTNEKTPRTLHHTLVVNVTHSSNSTTHNRETHA